ncbi:MAG: sigma-70 family RNA polymerase sigma factor [Planctomycetota bacterium]
MTLESTHPSLLDRLRGAGDDAAWREFDGRYRELILRYALRRGLQPADAEDVLQVAMLQMMRTLPTFQYRPEVGRFRDYLRTVVRRAIHGWAQRQQRHVALLHADPEASPDLDRAWHEEWTLHHYRRAMEEVRETFRPESLRIFEGLLAGHAADELAARHDTTPAAIYKVKQRIRDRLREQIARQLHEEEFTEQRSRA